MIVDAHLHVWQAVPNHPNPTVTTVSPVSDVPIGLLRDYMDEYGVDRAVLVQPLFPGEDNSYVADCARADSERFAAVCVVDPRKAGAEDRLEHWVSEYGCRGLRLRPGVPGEKEAFSHPNTYPLWERADALDVVVNVLCNADDVPAIAEMAERFPGVNILIDHMGHPDVAAGVDASPFQALLGLARHERVHVKPSGYTYCSHEAYPHKDCWNIFHALYDSFGPARLVWGSDFPHILLKTGYRRCLLLQERAYTYLSPSELRLIMGENAARLYWREFE